MIMLRAMEGRPERRGAGIRRSHGHRTCTCAALLASLASAAGAALLPASAAAASFGPNLSGAVANLGYGCDIGISGVFPDGCTLYDPTNDSMNLVLPNPVTHGNQTGVVTDIHVVSAEAAPAQFVSVEWSGPATGFAEPFPSDVHAVSQQVELQPGLNNFNTNLPVDYRLADNGFESWSVVSLNILNGADPVPAESSGGSFASLGLLVDNGEPLTTIGDLTVPPHNPSVGGLGIATLLMSGDVTNTTPPPTAPIRPNPIPNPPNPIPNSKPPTDTVLPAVHGKAKRGKTLTCTVGTWAGAPTAFAFQWLRNGRAVSHGNQATHKVARTDVRHRLSCKVTARNSAGSASATSKSVLVKR
jgi:hypothetical protein